uniref:Uncharacterized protein n=1 Tax=Oryza sativa subsp. japonica TaxID=39947 RepID=Q6ZLL3_ORYSJ|nr:hypothetical protein [Oryza sativa Japonica Group]BAD30607.1 hypothetical protein [Oryza sativa Japonica Group]
MRVARSHRIRVAGRFCGGAIAVAGNNSNSAFLPWVKWMEKEKRKERVCVGGGKGRREFGGTHGVGE